MEVSTGYTFVYASVFEDMSGEVMLKIYDGHSYMHNSYSIVAHFLIKGEIVDVTFTLQ